ncbi:MAG TPA: glycosyltransferase family 4 protein, partial [Candidatus Limnocylindrales bacterium]|nr:glycosyltransferase family 4 protein [Candidatus Limnocylindrales bacterium]
GRLVCVSEAVSLNAARAGIAADKVLVLHDPPDPRWRERPAEEERGAFRRSLGIPEGVPVIGTVGNISPVKGTDVLVKALPAVVSLFPDVRCLIVGGDDHGLRKEIERTAGNAGVLGNLVFAGPVPDPRAGVSLMDVFVLPSRQEGYGLVLLEAMSYGKPVVASRVGGVPEIIPDDSVGVLVPPEDPDALGAAISGLLADPGRRERMGRAGTARIRERFGEAEMEKLYRMYLEIAPERKG